MYHGTWIDGVVLLPADPALPVSGVRVYVFIVLFKKKKLNDIFRCIIFDGPIDLLHKKIILFTCLFALGSFLGC